MKNFSIKYKDSNGDIYREVLPFKNITSAKYAIKEYGYDIIEEPIELEKVEGYFDKIKSYFNHTFSSHISFDEGIEKDILLAYAEAKKDGFAEKEALEATKTIFSRSEKKLRGAIDTLIDTYDK
jgi:hypothetical protein